MPLIAKIAKIEVQPRQVAQPDLVAWWKFNQAGYAAGTPRMQDSAALALHRAELFTGCAMTFDGVNDRAEYAYRAALLLPGSFSLVFTVKVSSTQANTNPGFLNFGNIAAGGGGGTGWAVDFGQASTWTAGKADIRLRWNGNNYEASNVLTQDTWHHVGITYNGTTLTIYVDGVRKISSAVDLSTAPRTHSGVLTLGVGDSTQFGNCQASMLLVYNVGLTYEQYRNLWRQPEQVKPWAVELSSLVFSAALGENNATLGTGMEGVAGITGVADLINGTSYTNTIGAPVAQAGLMRTRYAAVFDASTIYGDVSSAIPAAAPGNATWAAWFIVTATGARAIISGAANGYHLETNSGTVTFGKNGAAAIVTKAAAHNRDALTHVAVTRSGNFYTLYVNGVSVDTATTAIAITVSNLRIGATATGGSRFAGLILQASIYDGYSASPAEVLALSAGAKPDSIGQGMLKLWVEPQAQSSWKNYADREADVTAPGTVTVARVPDIMNPCQLHPSEAPAHLALNSTGYARVLDASTLDLTAAITVECWATALNPAAGLMCLVSKRNAVSQISWDLQINPGASTVAWVASSDGTTLVTITATGITTPFNEWQHYAATFGPAGVMIYVNGVLVKSDTSPGYTAIFASTASVYIGSSAGAANYMAGRIADLKIYSTQLTQATIKQNYDKHNTIYAG